MTTTTQRNTTKSTKVTKSREDRQAAMSARWKMLMDLAEQMEAAMEADEDVAAAVEALAVQTGYSIRNAALILGQCQHARQVHSFRAWKEQHARQVRKGEKALYVLAPTAKKKAQGEAAPDTAQAPAQAPQAPEQAPQQEQGAGEDAAAKRSRNFVLVPVFDVAQTEPMETEPAQTETKKAETPAA